MSWKFLSPWKCVFLIWASFYISWEGRLAEQIQNSGLTLLLCHYSWSSFVISYFFKLNYNKNKAWVPYPWILGCLVRVGHSGSIYNRVIAINLLQPSSFSWAWDWLWTKYMTLSTNTVIVCFFFSSWIGDCFSLLSKL